MVDWKPKLVITSEGKFKETISTEEPVLMWGLLHVQDNTFMIMIQMLILNQWVTYISVLNDETIISNNKEGDIIVQNAICIILTAHLHQIKITGIIVKTVIHFIQAVHLSHSIVHLRRKDIIVQNAIPCIQGADLHQEIQHQID